MRTLIAILLVTFTLPDLTAQEAFRTEEYAVISAWQIGRKTRISVQIGSESTPEKEFEPIKGEKQFDLGPVLREMEALNAMGFELVTGNSAIWQPESAIPYPYYTFVFKRRR
jgi:hypothetical protein